MTNITSRQSGPPDDVNLPPINREKKELHFDPEAPIPSPPIPIKQDPTVKASKTSYPLLPGPPQDGKITTVKSLVNLHGQQAGSQLISAALAKSFIVHSESKTSDVKNDQPTSDEESDKYSKMMRDEDLEDQGLLELPDEDLNLSLNADKSAKQLDLTEALKLIKKANICLNSSTKLSEAEKLSPTEWNNLKNLASLFPISSKITDLSLKPKLYERAAKLYLQIAQIEKREPNSLLASAPPLPPIKMVMETANPLTQVIPGYPTGNAVAVATLAADQATRALDRIAENNAYPKLESKAETHIAGNLKNLGKNAKKIRYKGIGAVLGNLKGFMDEAVKECPKLTTRQRVDLCKKALISALQKHGITVNYDHILQGRISYIEMGRLHGELNTIRIELRKAEKNEEEGKIQITEEEKTNLKQKLKEKEEAILKAAQFLDPCLSEFRSSRPFDLTPKLSISKELQEKSRQAFLANALAKPSWDLKEAELFYISSNDCSDTDLATKIKERYEACIRSIDLKKMFAHPEPSQKEKDLLSLITHASESPLKEVAAEFKVRLATSPSRFAQYTNLAATTGREYDYMHYINDLMGEDLALFQYKRRTLADMGKVENLIAKADMAMINYEEGIELDPSEKLTLEDMGNLSDLKQFHEALFNKLEITDPELTKTKKLCEKAAKFSDKMLQLAHVQASANRSLNGAVVLKSQQREVALRRFSSNIGERVRAAVIGNFYHSGKAYADPISSKVQLSHMWGGYYNHEADLKDMLCMDFFNIDPQKLIKPEMLAQIKAKIPSSLAFDALIEELSQQYEEIEFQIHDDLESKFENLDMNPKGPQKIVGAIFHCVDRTDAPNPQDKRVRKVMESVTLPKQLPPGGGMSCSEFAAKTTTAALIKLDQWLKEKLASIGIQTNEDDIGMHALKLPIDANRRFETVFPGEILELYKKAGAIEKLPPPEVFAAIIKDFT